MAMCDVYWGSHGCHLPKGHRGWCVCPGCKDDDGWDGYVGSFPYYGWRTRFYGDDARWATIKFQLARWSPARLLRQRWTAEGRRAAERAIAAGL